MEEGDGDGDGDEDEREKNSEHNGDYEKLRSSLLLVGAARLARWLANSTNGNCGTADVCGATAAVAVAVLRTVLYGTVLYGTGTLRYAKGKVREKGTVL